MLPSIAKHAPRVSLALLRVALPVVGVCMEQTDVPLTYGRQRTELLARSEFVVKLL